MTASFENVEGMPRLAREIMWGTLFDFTPTDLADGEDGHPDERHPLDSTPTMIVKWDHIEEDGPCGEDHSTLYTVAGMREAWVGLSAYIAEVDGDQGLQGMLATLLGLVIKSPSFLKEVLKDQDHDVANDEKDKLFEIALDDLFKGIFGDDES